MLRPCEFLRSPWISVQKSVGKTSFRCSIQLVYACVEFSPGSGQILFILFCYKPFKCIDNVNCAYNSRITAVIFFYLYKYLIFCVFHGFDDLKCIVGSDPQFFNAWINLFVLYGLWIQSFFCGLSSFIFARLKSWWIKNRNSSCLSFIMESDRKRKSYNPILRNTARYLYSFH